MSHWPLILAAGAVLCTPIRLTPLGIALRYGSVAALITVAWWLA